MAMRRVLIVSPNFPPINAADHQRVRMSLPYFEEFGWRPTVLAVRPEDVEGTDDPLLKRTLPKGLEVVRTGAVPLRWSRAFGLGSLALRALPAFWRAGNRLLARERFDAVYFSTTMFAVMALGPLWRRKFSVPYILDFQDPWIDDYYAQPGAPPPPGGRFKYSVNQGIARVLEPLALRGASEIIAVSPAYIETLRARYPGLAASQCTVLPFGAPDRDFEQLDALGVRQNIFDRDDGRRHWTYVGRGGPDMAVALRLLFRALAEARERAPQQWAAVRLHFVGTSYAPEGRAAKTIEPVARTCGVEDLVEERTARIPYFQALQLLRQSDVILVTGSDGAGYSASKLYPCMLARRPLLALLHGDSPAVAILRQLRAGHIVTFDPRNPDAAVSAVRAAIQGILFASGAGTAPNLDTARLLAEHGARAVTARQCEVFDRAVARLASTGGGS
jgi:hypothetical protein